jgi:hypothetical protein
MKQLRALLAALTLVAALAPEAARGQAPSDSTAPAEDLEQMLDEQTTDAETGEQLAERLARLAENPLRVNTASAAELADIPALTPLAAQRITQFRRENGPFGSLPELRRVEGVTSDVFLEARPYLRIGKRTAGAQATDPYPDPPAPGAVMRNLEYKLLQRVDRRIDLGRGYGDDSTRTTFLGSPEKLYTHLEARYERRVQLALTLEKDPGERFTWEPDTRTYGYDHVAGHLTFEDMGRLQTLVAGDFTASYGQGLALWSGTAFGKGRDPIGAVARSSDGLDGYASRTEDGFFRGLGATVRVTPDVSVSGWASRRLRDATLTDAPKIDSTRLVASNLVASGYHRTPNELAKKNALGEMFVGGAAEWSPRGAQLGLTAYHARYDRALEPPDRPYARYDFAGRRLTTASVYGRAFVGDLYLFGEAARAGGAYGAVAGGIYEAGRFAEVALTARRYPKDFASPYGSGFGERSGSPQNESGLYVGLRLKPAPNWTVAAYVDQYRFPWLRFTVPRPSQGYEARLVVEHRPRPWLQYYVQARTETRDTGFDYAPRPDGPRFDATREETRQSLRLHVSYEFADGLRLRSRLEGARYAAEGLDARRGFLLFQDLRWQPHPALRLDARLALFDTDGYPARIYVYENDLLYSFSVPAFFGRGQRAYLLARYEPLDDVVLELKYAATRYEHQAFVGSGLNRVAGNRLREVRGQLRWTF